MERETKRETKRDSNLGCEVDVHPGSSLSELDDSSAEELCRAAIMHEENGPSV